MLKYWITTTIAALFLFLGAGCSGGKEALDNRGWPRTLTFAYWVDDEVPGLRLEATDELAKYLADRLNLEVELKKSTQYGPVIEAMRANKVDISMYGTFAYILASSKAGAECISIRGTDAGHNVYHSLIVTRPENPIYSLDDLKRKGKSLSFAFTNPASTSGHLIPRAYLEKEGLFPKQNFKELVFPGKHNATVLAVRSGKVDVGCVSENTYRKLVMLKNLDPEQIRIIWKSPPIPDGCIAVREGLPEDLKKSIQSALVELPGKYPERWKRIKKIYTYSANPESYYILADDSHYDPIRELATSIENLDMLN